MSTETTSSLSITRVIQAERASVFRAWTEPEQLMRWSCPETVSVKNATVDLKVGGAYTITMRIDEETDRSCHVSISGSCFRLRDYGCDRTARRAGYAGLRPESTG